jgi:hypothetical protein
MISFLGSLKYYFSFHKTTKINDTITSLIICYFYTIDPGLIFFVHPNPRGSEENQFAPLGAGVKKLIFERNRKV